MSVISNFFKRIDRRAELMGGMMERLGVDFSKPGNDTLGYSLERTVRACMLCRHEEECCDWQAATIGARVAEAPEFCPNRAFFASHRA